MKRYIRVCKDCKQTFETDDNVWMCKHCRYKRLRELVQNK